VHHLGKKSNYSAIAGATISNDATILYIITSGIALEPSLPVLIENDLAAQRNS
jgi:hypothetical protein